MAYLDNKPPIEWLLEQLAGVPTTVLSKFDAADGYPLLQRLLAASCAWVEDVCSTAFNAATPTTADASFTDTNGVTWGLELYDGNGTNQIVLRKRPALSVIQCQVVTPILGYTRVYTPQEIKLYRKQGVLKVFTYKLAVEQALLQTVDYQAWGSLFPPLPQAVQVAYAFGFPAFDPVAGLSTYDTGRTTVPGDWRTSDYELANWLVNLQQAAICDAAASFLAQAAGTTVGLVTSVSFDGYSRGLNPQAFGAQVEALVKRRDELLARRRRQFAMGTISAVAR